ncbi:putative hemolysin-III channel protein Izh2 [Rhizophagus irregularis]|uniref:Putative hemolysin-III channel protein Izh2 n=1 Tax=Rhizophagus irregularis TaxID=588596 RepID=A0A2I1FWW0_9GLOM|nr:putative hemolysin-III channel protein Izh2 [Rhizophagus irregularis]
MTSSYRTSSENTVSAETSSIATKVNEVIPSSRSLTVSLTCNFGDLPTWLQDNHDILKGYRRPTFSYVKCAKSLFYIHNESVNIWSHLIGTVAFFFLGFTTYYYVLAHQPNAKTWDFFVFYIFLLGAMICLAFSSTFHTLCCHSEKVCANWNRCDYIGIVTLIVGSFFPMIYYGFYCNKVLQIVYLSMISIFGAATISVAVLNRFRSPQFRWFRASLFIAMGLSAFVPLIHAIFIYGIQLCFDVISLKWLLLMGALYITGAVIYGARVPEKWYPGTFDIYGSSHQIFHFFVIAAALVHYIGIIQAMTYWHEQNHLCLYDVKKMAPKAYL